MAWNGLISQVPFKEIHTMTHRQLPIGIQSLRRIREQGCYYVDKTPMIQRLIGNGDFYFLSRPRRFGKSLLVDTLRELFEGNESLFRDLAIHDKWDWSIKNPVVRISFGGKYDEPGDLQDDIATQLAIVEHNAGLAPAQSPSTTSSRLRDLLNRLHQATGQRVVVLVDEYDKPVLDVIDNPGMAAANRDDLREFYGTIKGSTKDVRFVFVTGVSMLSQSSLYSGLNNLDNISLEPEYAAICGYTDTDLDTVFAPELPGLDREQIRQWYLGYDWLGDEKLYNPFGLLLLFRKRRFSSYWFETGSPTLLYRIMMEQGVSPMELEHRRTDAKQLSKFDIDDIGMEALLFQTGYLTITAEEKRGPRTLYTLGYPNFEVLHSLNHDLLGYITRPKNEFAILGDELSHLLVSNDFDSFAVHLRTFFAGIPYLWQTTNDPARYEAWYAGVLYAWFRTIGLDLQVEVSSGRSRADMVVLHGGQVFIFEFKMATGEGDSNAAARSAIQQMQEKGYAEKYRGRGEPVHLVGVAFDPNVSNLVVTIRQQQTAFSQIPG